jgi:hypothetical protein
VLHYYVGRGLMVTAIYTSWCRKQSAEVPCYGAKLREGREARVQMASPVTANQGRR